MRYKILKAEGDCCCEIKGKSFDDANLAVSFMRTAEFSTYLLDTKTNKIVAEYTVT